MKKPPGDEVPPVPSLLLPRPQPLRLARVRGKTTTPPPPTPRAGTCIIHEPRSSGGGGALPPSQSPARPSRPSGKEKNRGPRREKTQPELVPGGSRAYLATGTLLTPRRWLRVRSPNGRPEAASGAPSNARSGNGSRVAAGAHCPPEEESLPGRSRHAGRPDWPR